MTDVFECHRDLAGFLPECMYSTVVSTSLFFPRRFFAGYSEAGRLCPCTACHWSEGQRGAVPSCSLERKAPNMEPCSTWTNYLFSLQHGHKNALNLPPPHNSTFPTDSGFLLWLRQRGFEWFGQRPFLQRPVCLLQWNLSDFLHLDVLTRTDMSFPFISDHFFFHIHSCPLVPFLSFPVHSFPLICFSFHVNWHVPKCQKQQDCLFMIQ